NDAAGRDFIGYHSIRKIPAYKGQGHLPGFYWFSGLNQLVPYESRLEMFTLMGFDFDGGVIGVLAQPLMLHFERSGETFRHVPDFLVWRERGGVTVVDVKRSEQAGASRNRRAFESTEVACQHLGWGFEVRTEPDDTYLANVKVAGRVPAPPTADRGDGERVGRRLCRWSGVRTPTARPDRATAPGAASVIPPPLETGPEVRHDGDP